LRRRSRPPPAPHATPFSNFGQAFSPCLRGYFTQARLTDRRWHTRAGMNSWRPGAHRRRLTPEGAGNPACMARDRDQVRHDFDEVVNMTPKELEEWLTTAESTDVGQKDGGESVGHASGRRIVHIKQTRKDDLSDDDLEHMRKVVGYVRRHLAQGGPQDDMEHSAWRYSLMNWGHDPLK
jgi:hypothetical protein